MNLRRVIKTVKAGDVAIRIFITEVKCGIAKTGIFIEVIAKHDGGGVVDAVAIGRLVKDTPASGVLVWFVD